MLKYLTLAAMLLCIASCKKYDRGTGESLTLETFFRDMAPPVKQATITAEDGGSFRGNSGTRYVIPASMFLDANGNAVTGPVEIAVREYLSKSDMLLGGAVTVSNDKQFISDGAVFVAASDGNGGILRIAPGKSYSAYIPQNEPPVKNTQHFYGRESATVIDWYSVGKRGNTGYVPDTTIIRCDTLGYSNAGQFPSPVTNPKITVRGRLNGDVLSQAGEILCCYAVYDNIKVVWPLHHTYYMEFLEDKVAHTAVHFVMILIRNGQLYSGILAATPTDNEVYIVDLLPTTKAALKASLDAL